MASADTQVAVIGGGVVGCAVARALARRGVEAVLLEVRGPRSTVGARGTVERHIDGPIGVAQSTELAVSSGLLLGIDEGTSQARGCVQAEAADR